MTVPSASDNLLVINPLSISKSFTDDPVLPGGNVTLEFTITNSDPGQGATNIAFTDDVGAILAGLVAVGLPAADVCGVGSGIVGTDILTITGGTIPASSSCTFDVTLQVPAGAPSGIVVNTTSAVTGDLGATSVTGNTATDNLTVGTPVPLPERRAG